jgi:hypothetical protein
MNNDTITPKIGQQPVFQLESVNGPVQSRINKFTIAWRQCSVRIATSTISASRPGYSQPGPAAGAQKWEAGEINVPLATLARIQEVFGCKREGLVAQPKPKRVRAG